jgi:hypothetical protein
LEEHYPGNALTIKIDETAGLFRKSDRRFAAIPVAHQPEVARQLLLKDIFKHLSLPSFEEWCKKPLRMGTGIFPVAFMEH